MPVGWSLPAWPGHLARHRPARGLEVEHGDLRLQQRGLHPLALARDVALDEGDERTHGGVVAAGQVGDGDADAHRSLARQPGDRHQAAHALRDLVEARPIAVGTVLAEARQAHIDEARIDLAQRLVVEAEPVLHVGPVVLDQHVGAGRQLLQDGDAVGRLEVERDAALVAMQVEEVGTVARAAHHRVLVALLRHLDLDHVGAPVGEVARRRRAGAGPRQIDHLEAGQGALAFGAHCDITRALPSSMRAAWPTTTPQALSALPAQSTRPARHRPDWCPGNGSATWSSP